MIAGRDCARFTDTNLSSFFFFNDTATTEIYTLSLHDALPILSARGAQLRPGTDPRDPAAADPVSGLPVGDRDRKSTRLNSSHSQISYAVFCLKKKNIPKTLRRLMPSCLRKSRRFSPPITSDGC